jgi:hypothetical protein
MRGQQRGRNQRREAPAERAHPRSGLRARPSLPTWESFPAEERHRVVSAILQAVRRQVETRAMDRLPRS